jgi:hypothetical protein
MTHVSLHVLTVNPKHFPLAPTLMSLTLHLRHCPARPGNPVFMIGVCWIARSSRAMTAKWMST